MTAPVMVKPEVKTFFDKDTFTCTHVVKDPDSNHCAALNETDASTLDPETARLGLAAAAGRAAQ